MTFTKNEMGVWIDGGFGMAHAMQKLAQMTGTLAKTDDDKEALKVLATGDPEKLSDDHWELDHATGMLEDVTSADLTWEWDGGDLLLIDMHEE